MKKPILHTFLLLILPFLLRGQSTVAFPKVYSIFQSKCISCHSNAQKSGGLDLEGNGTDKSGVVFSNLVNKTPINLAANSKGHKLVYPGRVDKSFLFHKINADFDAYYPALTANEGLTMPQSGTVLTKTEKEIIRQWILYGADKTVIIPEGRIRAYYDTVGRGLAAYDIPPPAPTTAQGFQLRMGPFFLAPQGTTGSEIEYYQKWELSLPNDIEVNRLDHLIGSSSHHLIIYYFSTPSAAATIPAGLRTEAYHSGISLVSAVQGKTDLRLPDKTAFKWEKNRILDLNSHYINYSANHIYKADAFINVYTQPNGTAKQEMMSFLIPNDKISIPTGSVTQEAPFIYTGKIFLWGIMGHTHKYGTGYKVFKRLPNGAKSELLYDAACPTGTPGCVVPFFDYQHIPMRYFQPLKEVDLNPGIIHQATWNNTGTKTLAFGPTSADEMMVLTALFTTDTTGLTSSKELVELEGVKVFPNPMSEQLMVSLPPSVLKAKMVFYDLLGREIKREEGIETQMAHIARGNLKQGIYIYKIEDQRGYIKTGKIIVN
jgi:Secretion system C-terminal sorting domain